ncbi:alpha/beta hydrolase [Paenibacillus sp. BSR1-1]|uniref:alpha/beta hydrolase n=1 Tax=Paenibacillus sp. BSR1-1 TaxID=3020845 RepID=UPI0025B15665|nr:alpha/beta hydrolase [Paenibacillus sp. BSR1-1]MDN3017038.1 alpha/beta hydrolase [Paenibacillus sp. BSR1-1]
MKDTLIYKQIDDCSIRADFYGTSLENSPVVIYIHGGGLVWGTREEITEEMIKLYTNNGISLFSIDYRLAPETKLQDILEDVEDSLHWLQTEGAKRFSIDPKRIAVVGSSAGGFLALSTGTFKHKPRAIVSFYGYGDLLGSWAASPSKYYLEKDLVPRNLANALVTDQQISKASVEQRFLLYVYARQHGVWVEEITGVNPAFNKEALRPFCPIHNVTKEYPPTLLLHGTKDKDVPFEQSVFMRAAILKQSVEAKLITIPNGEHVFDKEFHNPIVQSALKQVIEFLHTHFTGIE